MADTLPQGGLAATPSAATEEKDDSTNIGYAKAAPIKVGKNITLPAVGGAVPVSESVLENMQKLIAEKEAQKSSFMEGLKDATAWWSGGLHGPSEALAKRGAERDAQAAELFQMQNALAQYKAAQEAQRQFELRRNKELGVGTPGAAGTPGVEGAPGLYDMPDPIKQALRNAKTEEEYKKIYNSWAQEVGKAQLSPERNKLYDVVIGDKTYQKPLWWIQQNPQLFTEGSGNKTNAPITATAPTTGGVTTGGIATVESGGNAAAVSPKGAVGVMQVMPNTLKDPGYGVTPAKDDSAAELKRVGEEYYGAMQNRYKNDTLAAIAYNMGPNKTDEWLAAGGDFSKLPKETQDYIGKVHLATALQSRQPAATTAPVAKSGSKEEASAAGKLLESEATETGKTLAARGQEIEKNRENYGTNVVRADKIITLADRNKDVLGVFVKPGVVSMVGTGLKEGIKVGPHGQLALPAIEEMTAQMTKGVTGTKLQERRDLAQTLHEVELDLSKLLKGQGTVSDAERRILAGIAGSVSDPADLLRKKALVLKLHAEYDKEMGDAFRKSNMPFSQFKKTDAYQQAVDNHTARLIKNFENEYKGGRDIPYDETSAPTKSAPALKGDERKNLLKKWG